MTGLSPPNPLWTGILLPDLTLTADPHVKDEDCKFALLWDNGACNGKLTSDLLKRESMSVLGVGVLDPLDETP